MLNYYVEATLGATLNATLCVYLYYYPMQGLLPILLPTLYTSMSALWYIWITLTGTTCVRDFDHRGREHDLTLRKVLVVSPNCTETCGCFALLKSQEIANILTVDTSRTQRNLGQFDFCVLTRCSTRWRRWAFHEGTNLALANRGIAAITTASPWDWRGGAEGAWGRVKYLPEEGTIFSLNHPAVVRCGELRVGDASSSRLLLAYSSHTLVAEDWRTYVDWGVKPPCNLVELYEFYSMPARLFALMFTLGVNRRYAWGFLLYGPIVLAHILRLFLYLYHKPRNPASGFQEAVENNSNQQSETARHGHQFEW